MSFTTRQNSSVAATANIENAVLKPFAPSKSGLTTTSNAAAQAKKPAAKRVLGDMTNNSNAGKINKVEQKVRRLRIASMHFEFVTVFLTIFEFFSKFSFDCRALLIGYSFVSARIDRRRCVAFDLCCGVVRFATRFAARSARSAAGFVCENIR